MTRAALMLLILMTGLAGAHAAGFQCDKFQKDGDGAWHALEPVEIFGPNGRLDFTPGETYKTGETKQGLDIAKLLEANCAKK